jgi:hypothetical protein
MFLMGRVPIVSQVELNPVTDNPNPLWLFPENGILSNLPGSYSRCALS